MGLLGRRTPVPPMPTPRPVTPGLIEAQRVHADARARLVDAIDQGPEIRGVIGRIVEHGRKNHFGPMIEDIWARRENGNT